MSSTLEGRPSPRESAPTGKLSPQELERLDRAIETYKTEGPPLSEFADVRPQHLLEHDQQQVAGLKKIFAAEHGRKGRQYEIQRYADALELLLLDFSSSWLPGYLSKASEYDDFINKTDLVLEMENDHDQILRIAIDVTTNPDGARTKIADIVRDLRTGLLSRLRYFRSELDDSRDQKFLPRVVVGTDNLEQTAGLIRLYLTYKETTDTAQRNILRHSIENHPIGREMLGQIMYELQRTVGVLKSADTPREDRDEKIAMVEATITELEQAQKKKAARANSSSSSPSRNGVLTMIFKAFASA